ncbi:PREDICTED: uncharacterized protein LOC109585486 [Amphimedon queenslandica]|uniref:Nucleoside phosphorylase domain-containing protein n=1 Tax=Amphimedon queenslandica TaxID=400682 RepID=A0AAN0JKB5_AMPQE|nr:PREDICTED: uncharacterized protein LOC109585486 [Amphimedon queenslandica]|eukprot:XP_019857143.1 PREDICTED: uncharacterized protein LOC109585486 [Amphimedon queenslandica]
MIDDQPSCLLFAKCLKPLVDWKPFALCLPQITQSDVNIIYKKKKNAHLMKMALHKRWLQVNPTASWRDVINALKQCKENELATTIEDKVTDPTARNSNEDMEATDGSANPITETNGAKQASEKIDSKEPLDNAATGPGESKSDDQITCIIDPPPDVSKYCPRLEDIEKKILMKKLSKLTKEEKELIEKVSYILVTATPIEYCAVMGSTDSPGGDGKYIRVVIEDKSARFILGKFGPCNVAIISTGQGPDKTDRVLTLVQRVVKAKYVIAIGICYGAKESKTKVLGDKRHYCCQKYCRHYT